MTMGTWGEHASKGIVRAVIAAFFAMALVLAVAAPAAADMHDAEDGFYFGWLEDVDREEQWIDATVWLDLDEGEEILDDLDNGEEEFFDDEEEFDEDPETLRFHLLEHDFFWVNDEEDLTKDEFLCAAEIILTEAPDEHVFFTHYHDDVDEESEFGLWADVDEPEDGWCPPEPEEEEHDEPQPVQPAERVDTGAGGTSGGAGALALLFGLIAAAGATVLRKGSATS